MERGTPVSWNALLTAIVALALGVAALVLALDNDNPQFGFQARVPAPAFSDDDGFPRFGTPGPEGLRPRTETRPDAQPSAERARPQLGVRVEESDTGLVVTVVAEDSGADEAGIEVGDVIT
ncbi:MAG TPA: PDZ domain-containing protein [Dehalococcoidia bacterium]|nr:PDZ domain-containing protein [Dehalococcoidia bacterium]